MFDEPQDADGSIDPAGEEDLGPEIETVAPNSGHGLTRVVALGGSAGGIQAMQQFFRAMPADSGMAFVVVLHLAPDHASALSSILQQTTSMPVEQAADGRKLEPNHVYVIPPGKQMTTASGHLRLIDMPADRSRRMTVDLLFRSLADTHGARAVGIVMSGLDGDGTLGVKRIKERGGLTIAQDPNQAEHPSMPRSAIGTTMVDWVLDVEKMPERLLDYQAREHRLQIPSESGPPIAARAPSSPMSEEGALRDVLSFLRTRTGRDFSNYKRATIVRRLARRMQVNEVDSLGAYLDFLRVHPGEAGALLQDLLISVTNFFRDREAFDALAQQIPYLFRGKSEADTVRVWVPACATGEEAYSIAMLLSEHARTLETPPSLQVFGTDLDEDVLGEARNGYYPSSIVSDVSSERLQRFFVKEHHGYRIRRELREMLLFAVHDVLKDSPFSRIDLVSCRNLLIYLNRSAQKHVFDIFHFALRNEGTLFLGTSEAADEAAQLFQPIDKKHRIYSARLASRSSLPIPSGPSSIARTLALQQSRELGASLARKLAPGDAAANVARLTIADRISWGELHLKLIERFGPPSLIVDGNNNILHVSERAAAFLHFSSGEPSMNLFRAVHPSLAIDIRATLFRARQTGQPASMYGANVELNQQRRLVDIHISQAADLSPDLSLVVFDVREAGTNEPRQGQGQGQGDHESVARQLERELEHTKRDLREVLDQQEASTEELQAGNEELQAMNEELRSATEELETSREELQAINEELTTVNYQLKAKVEELGQANSHLHNLMGATEIATVFLDRELRIMRFTPPAIELFSMIAGDIGRPLANLRHQLNYPELLDDAARVLERLVPIEREVEESSGRFFLSRLLPYRAAEDRIAGVVLTFVDVSELHKAKETIRHAQLRLEERVRERTAQLDSVNQALRAEIEMHERAEKARRDLQRRLVNAQEQERSRISRELHDEVGQQIMALMLALKAAESADLSDKVREARAIAEQIGREIHQLAAQLRPVALDEVGLARALSGYLDSWTTRSGIAVDFFSVGLEEARLPNVVETTIYRVVQEAMNNIAKHAAAKNVSVNIERRAHEVLTIVEDDGAGFEPDKLQDNDYEHLGIAGMRERAAIIGGELAIESRPGGGTTVRIRLPLPKA